MSEKQSLEKIVQVPTRRPAAPWTAICLGGIFVGAIAAYVGASAAYLSMTPTVVQTPVVAQEARENCSGVEPPQCDSTFIYSTLLRSAAQELFEEESSGPVRGARIVPAIKSGKAIGFKIYSLRPGSLPALVGIRNGDTIHTIAGVDLSTPDKALGLYNFLSQTEPEEIPIELTRDGRPITLVVTLL